MNASYSVLVDTLSQAKRRVIETFKQYSLAEDVHIKLIRKPADATHLRRCRAMLGFKVDDEMPFLQALSEALNADDKIVLEQWAMIGDAAQKQIILKQWFHGTQPRKKKKWAQQQLNATVGSNKYMAQIARNNGFLDYVMARCNEHDKSARHRAEEGKILADVLEAIMGVISEYATQEDLIAFMHRFELDIIPAAALTRRNGGKIHVNEDKLRSLKLLPSRAVPSGWSSKEFWGYMSSQPSEVTTLVCNEWFEIRKDGEAQLKVCKYEQADCTTQ